MVEIFGTLGPSCAQEETLIKMFEEGMTGMRLNLSHTSLREGAELIRTYQSAAAKAGVKPDLLIDMQGPELRIGTLEGPMELETGSEVRLATNRRGQDSFIPVPGNVFRALKAGDRVLLDDGKLELEIRSLDHGKDKQEKVSASVLRGGILTGRKSIKIEGKLVRGETLTGQDLANIRDARAFGVTALMQPFVGSGEELKFVKQTLKEAGTRVRVFAKIENMEGVRNLDGIIREADMVVIARGDLGNDMPLWELPRVQKEISEKCKKTGVPFLVVTQMLASMAHSAVPTRAEVSDIFNAVADGASAVMVTNETAVGDYPVDVIRYLKKTAVCAEQFIL